VYQIHRKLAKPLKRFRDYLVSPVNTLLKQGNETLEEIERNFRDRLLWIVRYHGLL